MRCSFSEAGMKGGRPVSVQCHTVEKLVVGRSFHIQLFLGFVNFYDGQYSRGMYYGLNPARSIRAVYDQSLYSYSLHLRLLSFLENRITVRASSAIRYFGNCVWVVLGKSKKGRKVQRVVARSVCVDFSMATTVFHTPCLAVDAR